MRKNVACLLAGPALLLAAVAACGAPNAEAPSGQPAPATQAATPEPPAANPPADPPDPDSPYPQSHTEVEMAILPQRELKCDLATQPLYHIGEPVEVNFRLTNTGAVPLWVLRWNTPLEGLIGDCFEIFRDGQVVFFEGRMIKRASPEAKEYLVIAPGATLESKVDLRAAYKVDQPGKYTLSFDTVLFDVVDDEKLVPRGLDEHQSFDPRCPAVVFEIR